MQFLADLDLDLADGGQLGPGVTVIAGADADRNEGFLEGAERRQEVSIRVIPFLAGRVDVEAVTLRNYLKRPDARTGGTKAMRRPA